MDQTMDQWTDQQTIEGWTDVETLSYRGKEASEIENAQKKDKIKMIRKEWEKAESKVSKRK